jgi:hypothetical protein
VTRLEHPRSAGMRLGALPVVVLLALAAPAYAQSEPPIHRLEVEAGAGWLGGGAAGTVDANLRANATTEQPYRLFATDSRFAAAGSLHARAAVALSRRVAVEGGVLFSRPRLRTSVSADVESAPALTVDERIDQYVVEAGVLVRLDEIRLGRRTVPFVAGGAGYLRQLHEGLTVIEHGHLFYLGGGVTHWLLARDGGFVKSAGLRADGRVYVMVGGVSFDGRPRPHPAASGSLVIGF